VPVAAAQVVTAGGQLALRTKVADPPSGTRTVWISDRSPRTPSGYVLVHVWGYPRAFRLAGLQPADAARAWKKENTEAGDRELVNVSETAGPSQPGGWNAGVR
jgi:hypothetical protein